MDTAWAKSGSTTSSCSSLCASEVETNEGDSFLKKKSKEIDEIVADLVIEKFTDTLTHYDLRRLQRKQKKILNSEESSLASSAASSMEKLEAIEETNKSSDQLARKSVVLYHVMLQTSKALRFCQSSREFFGSTEHVEAERLLLFASVRRDVILEELRKESVNEIHNPHRGTVTISKLTFTPRAPPLQNNSNNKNPNSTPWYVCLLKNGTKIFCTEATSLDQNTNGTAFGGKYIFEDLRTYFEIELCFYVFVAEKKKSKFFLTEGQDYVAEPSFKHTARTTIRIADLKKETIKASMGTICLKIEAQVRVEENFRGFLTVGVENRGTMAWNRRFCFLDGRRLKFWNYPQDEDADVVPLDTVNLENCATGVVNTAERCLCSRPRTLLLETYETSGVYKTLTRRFLSADTAEEMKIWREKINAAVLTLRSWGENRSECFSKCSEI